MHALDIMTTPVVTIATSASVADAADLMLTRNIRCLPVVGDDGSLAGIISEGDFLRRGELGTRRARPRWLEFLVGPGKLAFSGVQLAFKNDENDVRIAYTRTEKALETVGAIARTLAT